MSRISLFPEWVEALPLQQQAVLALAMRGPDGFDKHHASKPVLWFMRACVMRAAHTGKMMEHGEHIPTFMSMRCTDPQEWTQTLAAFRSVEDELPLHYYSHLMHSAEVLAYRHPDPLVRKRWDEFYLCCCDYLHVQPETPAQMNKRLCDFGRLENVV